MDAGFKFFESSADQKFGCLNPHHLLVADLMKNKGSPDQNFGQLNQNFG